MHQVPKWEIFEVTLSSPQSYANPFLDVDLSGTFSHHSRTHEVQGFYDGTVDGEHVWRVRFAPMEEGDWDFRTHSNVARLETGGSFTCTPAMSAGGLHVDPVFSNWFIRADGSHTFISNDGWYPHVANRSGRVHVLDFEDVDFQQPSEADFLRYLDILAEHRVNLVIDIGQLYARQSSITDTSFRWPWKVVDADANRIDRDRFNLDYYQRMDRQMTHAKQKGIFFAMELLYDNSVVRPRDWAHHPSNIANGGWLEGNEADVGWNAWFDLDNATHMTYVRRYVDYTWARYGAYWNVLWSIGSENGNLARINDERLPQAFMDPRIQAEWYSFWVDHLNRRDPYARLKSLGDTGRQDVMVTSTYNDFVITQDPRNYPKDDVRDWYRAMNAFGSMMWKFGRPVVIGEMTAGNNGHYDAERRLYWIALTAGYAMGRCDRHFTMVTDGALTESLKFGLNSVPPIYEAVRLQHDFVETRKLRFWRMRPSNRLVEHDGENLVFCLAAEGEEYLLYFVEGGSAALEVPAGQAEWFNPRAGTSHTYEVQAGRRTFVSPDESDWVLHVRAA